MRVARVLVQGLLAFTPIAVFAQATSRQPSAAASLHPFASREEYVAFYLAHTVEPDPACPTGIRVIPNAGRATSDSSTRAGARGALVITGRVHTAADQSLAGVIVSLEGLGVGGYSKEDGGFRLQLPPGTRARAGDSVALEARLIGFQRLRRVIPIGDVREITLDIGMCPRMFTLRPPLITPGLEWVTNTGDSGVQEGSVVIVRGEFVAVLRHRRLAVIRIAGSRAERIASIDAFAPLSDGPVGWEGLLSHGDDLIAFAERSEPARTEIAILHMDSAGGLARRASYEFQGGYAVRLAGDRLLLTRSVVVHFRADPMAIFPAMREVVAGGDSSAFRAFGAVRDVFRPAETWLLADGFTAYTLVRGELAGAIPAWHASVVLGPASAPDALLGTAEYIWSSDPKASAIASERASPVHLIRLPYDGSAPGAVDVAGLPLTGSSAMERSNGELYVLLNGDSSADLPAPGWLSARTALLRIPRSGFADGTSPAPRSWYRLLPRDGRRAPSAGRFIGDHVVYGGNEESAPGEAPHRSTLFVASLSGRAASSLSLAQSLGHLERMGGNLLAFGGYGDQLRLSEIELGPTPRVARSTDLRGVDKETRWNDGYFYQANGPNAGLLALPLWGFTGPGIIEEFTSGVFLLGAGARFEQLGPLAHVPQSEEECGVGDESNWSRCARVFAVKGRVFALLVDQIVEIGVRDRRPVELMRTTIVPDAGPP